MYIFGANQAECVPLVVYVFAFGVNQSECILLVSSVSNFGGQSAQVMMLKMRMIMLKMKMRVKMRVRVATSSVSQELLQHPPDILDRCLTTAGIVDRCLASDSDSRRYQAIVSACTFLSTLSHKLDNPG